MSYREQKTCRICKNPNLVEIMNLGTHTLSGRFPQTVSEEIPAYPLVLVKCMGENTCGLVQLKHDIDRDELYTHFYGYMSGINSTMKEHLRQVVSEICTKVGLKPGDRVLDIGSNDGTTLQAYPDYLQRTGIDPAGDQFQSLYPENIKLITGYFNRDSFSLSDSEKFKAVTSIAMFYDLPDPVEFAAAVKEILHPEGVWVMEQSYLPSMLRTNSFDTICHEHLEYYSFRQIEYIAAKVGLSILDLSFNSINGGSFRVTLGHVDRPSFSNTMEQTRLDESKLGLSTLEPYQAFAGRCQQIRDQLITFLHAEKKLGKTICVYGASTKGNVLLQYCGIDKELITCVAERNPYKYGRLTPLSHITIVSEREVREKRPDYMLVLPWHFRAEFLEREKAYMQNGGRLIFPLPELEVLPKKTVV